MHMDYMTNLLRITEYVPQLKIDALTVITERLVAIDVQMQTDQDDLPDDQVEQLYADVISEQEVKDDGNDNDSDDEDDDGWSSDDEDVTPEQQQIAKVKVAMAKMDAIMSMLFDYYEPAFSKDSTAAHRDDVADQLLWQFKKNILPNWSTRHAQFVIFHFAQRSELLVDTFMDLCYDVAFNSPADTLLKLSATSYLASFAARGARVSSETVRKVFDRLANEAATLRKTYIPNCYGPDKNRYSTYYAAMQAMLYLFCFRWRDFIITPDDEPFDDRDLSNDTAIEWHPALRETFHLNIHSKLNPLKVCSEVIVDQFASIAAHLRLMFVFPLIEQNKSFHINRPLISYAPIADEQLRGAVSIKDHEQASQLESYFPFDPFHLPKSKKWIQGDYVEWRPVPGLEDEVEGNSSEDGAEEVSGAKLWEEASDSEEESL